MLININPCYDILKRADCPDRKEGCASTCEKWRKHKEIKEQEYQRRVAQRNGRPQLNHKLPKKKGR